MRRKVQIWKFAGGPPPQSQLPPSCQRQSLHVQVYESGRPGHFRTHAQDPGHRRRVRAGRGATPGTAPSSLGVPECRACAPGPAYQLVSKGSLWFFFLLSLSLSLFPVGTKKKLVRLPGGEEVCLLSTGGLPSELSDLVSSLVIGSEGERNKERKTTDPFSSLRPPLEGTERCASLVRTGKSKCPSPAGRSRAGQQQLGGSGLTQGRQAVLCSGPMQAGQRARYLHVCPLKGNKKPILHVSKSSLYHLFSPEMKWLGCAPGGAEGGVQGDPGSGEKGVARTELTDKQEPQDPLCSGPPSYHRLLVISHLLAWGAGKAWC